MKILKDGYPNIIPVNFDCNTCFCEFEANPEEYYVEAVLENGIPYKVALCNCPCCKKVVSEKLTYGD